MNDYGDNGGPSDERLGPWYEEARQSVQRPGSALQWFGVASLVLAIIGIVLSLLVPDLLLKRVYDQQVKANRDLPPEKRQRVPPYDEFARTWTNVNLVTGLLQMAGSFGIMFGGMKMRQMQGYGLAIVASVLAIIPCNSCCCFGAIFGIWSLLTLLHSDVRLAFARTPPPGGELQRV